MHRFKALGVAVIALLAVTALTAAPALASGKPFVETKPATAITEATATLHGGVNPNGAETKYLFEYGATTSYGTKTAEASAGAGLTTIEESKGITGLTAGTTYHFRVVAKNANGTTNGADEVFTTSPKPGLPEFVPHAGVKGETFPLAVEGALNAVVSFRTPGIEPVACTGLKLKGSITGPKAIPVTITFEGCNRNVPGTHCGTGSPETEENRGKIVVSGASSLVYLNKSTKQVGILLPLGTVVIHCNFETEQDELRGSIVSPITPVNTETTKLEVRYRTKNNQDENEFTEYENEKGEKTLTHFEWNYGGGGWSAASLGTAAALTLTTPRAVTVKS